MTFSESGIYLLGIALVIGYFLILKSEFGEKHWLLKYVFIMGILLAGYFIPGVMLDTRTQCDFIVANATTSGSVTTYEYDSFCFTTETDTPETFYIVFAWLYYFLILYFLIKIFYDLYQYMKPKVMRFWEEYK